MDKLCFCLHICEKLHACPRVSMEESFDFHLQNAAHNIFNLTGRNQDNKQSEQSELISRIFPFLPSLLLTSIDDHIYFSCTDSD